MVVDIKYFCEVCDVKIGYFHVVLKMWRKLLEIYNFNNCVTDHLNLDKIENFINFRVSKVFFNNVIKNFVCWFEPILVFTAAEIIIW